MMITNGPYDQASRVAYCGTTSRNPPSSHSYSLQCSYVMLTLLDF